MGPCVKFVSSNRGIISKKKGAPFSKKKRTYLGGAGGPRGVWQKTILFHIFCSSRTLSPHEIEMMKHKSLFTCRSTFHLNSENVKRLSIYLLVCHKHLLLGKSPPVLLRPHGQWSLVTLVAWLGRGRVAEMANAAPSYSPRDKVSKHLTIVSRAAKTWQPSSSASPLCSARCFSSPTVCPPQPAFVPRLPHCRKDPCTELYCCA